MATKKKNKNKSTRSKAVGKNVKPTARRRQKTGAAKKSAKKASAPKKTAAQKKSSKEATSGTTAHASNASNKRTRVKTRGRRGPAFSRTSTNWRSGEQSGDLQGLSDVESADSESVDELLEEGNAFEAGVVSGVEQADRREEKEVRTREVPEDDVPQEYLDEE